jgi:hypothetical protein
MLWAVSARCLMLSTAVTLSAPALRRKHTAEAPQMCFHNLCVLDYAGVVQLGRSKEHLHSSSVQCSTEQTLAWLLYSHPGLCEWPVALQLLLAGYCLLLAAGCCSWHPSNRRHAGA